MIYRAIWAKGKMELNSRSSGKGYYEESMSASRENKTPSR
jgi:hypothetical protein